MFNRKFMSLFVGQLCSHFADAFIQIAIVGMIMAQVEKKGAIIAMVLFFFLLPSLIFSPVAGICVDKFSRKKILIFSSLYRLILVGCFAILLIMNLQNIALNEWFVYIFSFLIGIGTAMFYPAKMAIVPNIVKTNDLKKANAFVSSSGVLSITAGAIIAGKFIDNYGFLNCVYLDLGCYLLSCFSLIFIGKEIIKEKTKQNSAKKIMHYLCSHKKAFDMLLLAVILSLVSAILYSGINAIAADMYKMSVVGITKLKGYLGLGGIAGVLLTLTVFNKAKVHKMLSFSFLVLFITLFTIGFCNTYSKAMLWLGLIGICASILLISVDTILQKATPDNMRGKIFAFKSLATTTATLFGTLFVSLSLDLDISALSIVQGVSIFCLIMSAFIILFDKDFRYFLLKATLGQIFLFFFDYKVEGKENVPKDGKVILAGNHTGHLDPFIIQMALKRHLWFVTGPAAFKVPVIRHLLKYYNVLPLQFGKGIEALDSGVKKLKNGEAVIIFPEGKFTPDGNLCKFNRGVGIMAKEANCPIIPFAIKGGFEAWGRNKKLPKLFKTIVIQFGQPITDLERDEKEIAKELQERVDFIKKSLERRAFYKIKDKFHTNFLDLMQEKGDIYGQVKALSIKGKDGYDALSYIELSRSAKKLANYLIESYGIQRQDRIAILCESRPEFAIGMFASIQTGAITVPLDIKLTVNEHSNILNDCNPRILLCSSHYLEHAIEVKNNVSSIEKIYVLDEEEIENKEIETIYQLDGDISKDIGRPRSLDETALIVYTSGTTGNPKGVMISFGNIYSQLRDFEHLLKLSSKDTFLSLLPLNHLLELNVGFFATLYVGAKIVYIKSLSPKELTSVMAEKGITHMIVVPLIAKMLKNSVEKQIKKQSKQVQQMFDFMYKIAKYLPRKIRRIMFKSIIDGLGGKLECFVCGGAPLENSVAEFFDRIGVPAFQGYGLTETSPVISTNRYNQNKIGTVGQPLPSVKVKLSDVNEILVSGPNVMLGYYGKEEMTKEVIDEDGWFHTGDIGEIDNEGYLKITGRIKNMIVLGGGKKIFPEEVEAVLETSELIKELCVLSLKIKSGNKAGTEEVGAIIVPSDNLQNKDDEELQKIIENEVKTLSEKSLASYKTPTIVLIHREELPKTSTRKVKRKELLEWYETL